MGKGYRTTIVTMPSGVDVKVYASSKVSDALDELTSDMSLYHGVRLGQLTEAVYEQGKKDGALSVYDAIEATKKAIKHRKPGRPKKPVKAKRRPAKRK